MKIRTAFPLTIGTLMIKVLNNKYGDKLSKRGLDTSIKSLRNNGLTAKQVLDMATL